jgi:hypothetical protein
MRVITSDASEVSGERSYIATCDKPAAIGVSRVAKVELTTVPKYDEMLTHRNKLSSNTRRETRIVRANVE